MIADNDCKGALRSQVHVTPNKYWAQFHGECVAAFGDVNMEHWPPFPGFPIFGGSFDVQKKTKMVINLDFQLIEHNEQKKKKIHQKHFGKGVTELSQLCTALSPCGIPKGYSLPFGLNVRKKFHDVW